MKRIVTLAVIGVFIGLVLVVAIGCGSGSVTGPSDEGVSQGSVGTPTQKADPVPAPSPTPQPADAAATEPYVEFAADGSGKFCNPKTHVGSVTITYTKELDLSEIYGTPRTYHAEPGKCVQIPPAISVIMPDILPTLKCGTTWKKRVQQDANNGEISLAGKHLGHVFVDVEFSAEACCVESEETKTEVSYSEWGECTKEMRQSTYSHSKCYQSRVKIITTTTTFAQCQKKEPKVEITQETEKRECTCTVSCGATSATSAAAQGFSLPNSGEATELAWVDANVDPGPWRMIDKDEEGEEFTDHDGCESADISGASSAKVAIVKAGTTYQYYLNVHDGQTLCSYDPPGRQGRKDISHITYYGCK